MPDTRQVKQNLMFGAYLKWLIFKMFIHFWATPIFLPNLDHSWTFFLAYKWIPVLACIRISIICPKSKSYLMKNITLTQAILTCAISTDSITPTEHLQLVSSKNLQRFRFYDFLMEYPVCRIIFFDRLSLDGLAQKS